MIRSMNSVGPRVAGAVLVAAIASPAAASVRVVEVQTAIATRSVTRTTQVYLEAQRIRIEMRGEGGDQVVIFRGDQDVLWLVNPSEQSYREMTKADLDRMAGQMTDMMAQMEERLKSMPPDQQAMIRRMMEQGMGAGAMQAPAPSTTVYRKVGSGETIEQWTTDRYEGTRDGQKRWDVWTVPWSTVGLTAGDLSAFEQLGQFFSSFRQGAADDLMRIGSGSDEGYEGVPVRRIAYRDGAPHSQYDITEIANESFDDAIFTVPAGFRKEAMPMMGRP